MDNEKLVEIISKAQDEEISRIITQITKRQKKLHPDWEGMYLSFPLKYPDECRKIMEFAWRVLSAAMEDIG